jgi:hypothetical protein
MEWFRGISFAADGPSRRRELAGGREVEVGLTQSERGASLDLHFMIGKSGLSSQFSVDTEDRVHVSVS